MDPEACWEEALLHHLLFLQRIAQARQSAREGKGISIEQLRIQLATDPPVVMARAERDSETVT